MCHARSLSILVLFICLASPALAGDLDRMFGIDLGQPLALSSKQVQAVGSPGFGLEQYLLLFTPGYRPPFARYYATVDVTTKRVAEAMGVTRAYSTPKAAWKAFDDQIILLEQQFGTGMRLGGGNIWKIKEGGKSLTLTMHPATRTLSLTLGDDKRMNLGSKR